MLVITRGYFIYHDKLCRPLGQSPVLTVQLWLRPRGLHLAARAEVERPLLAVTG